MKTKTKRIGLAVVIVIGMGVVALLTKKEPPPQIITLPNGEKYEFAGVTYGKKPVPPTLPAQLLRWLPGPLSNPIRKHYGSSLSQSADSGPTTTPRLFVWFHRLGTNPPSPTRGMLSAMLADQAGVVAGLDGRSPSGAAWHCATFPVVPKRSRVLQCQISDFFGQTFGNVTFPNPVYGEFPQLEPESIPTVKQVGDLEVRLDKLETGYPSAQGYVITREPMEKPMFRLGPVRGESFSQAKDTAFDISLRSSEGTNMWALSSAELSDATGNVLRDPMDLSIQPLRTDWGGGYSKLTMGTLWPDEAAWRFKLEFMRPARLALGDLVTFRKVPILKAGASRSIQRKETLGPYEVVLQETMYRDGHGNDSIKWHLEMRNAPEDLKAEVVGAITDTGTWLSSYRMSEPRPGNGKYSVERFASLSSVPTNATTVDVTCAIQKTRTVEFLVQPPKAE